MLGRRQLARSVLRPPSMVRTLHCAPLMSCVLLTVVVPASAWAEASHHQGASAGQTASSVNTTALGSLSASPDADGWRISLFPSYLRAVSVFDDRGATLAMAEGGLVENLSLNAYVERTIAERWTISGVTAWQFLRIREPTETRSITSLGDSLLSVRYAMPFGWLTHATSATLKLPGTYPDTPFTSTKQVDAQLESFATIRPTGWLSATAGAGYRLRFGDIQDEVLATAILSANLGSHVTLSPAFIAAIPVGLGATAKNSVLAGATLVVRPARIVSLTAAYFRTISGRNIVVADVFTVGAMTTF